MEQVVSFLYKKGDKHLATILAMEYVFRENDRIVVTNNSKNYIGTVKKIKDNKLFIELDNGKKVALKKDSKNILGKGVATLKKGAIPNKSLNEWLKKSHTTQINETVEDVLKHVAWVTPTIVQKELVVALTKMTDRSGPLFDEIQKFVKLIKKYKYQAPYAKTLSPSLGYEVNKILNTYRIIEDSIGKITRAIKKAELDIKV